MPVRHPIEDDLKSGRLAVEHAKSVRRFHARRTVRGSRHREDDIIEARRRIAEAMKPLRSWMGRHPYMPQTAMIEQLDDQVRALSRDLQRQRRKLWKMSIHNKWKG